MNTCLIGGALFVGVSVPAAVVELPPLEKPPPPLPTAPAVGEGVVTVIVCGPPLPPEESDPPPEDSWLAAWLAGETATITGASSLAALPVTSDPTTTPNPSMLRTATAAARGAWTQESYQ